MSKRKVTFEIAARFPDEVETRNYVTHREGLERPSSRIIYFNCPFCTTEVKAYVWSLCGGGKRCPECSAIFGGRGEGYQFKNLIKVDKR